MRFKFFLKTSNNDVFRNMLILATGTSVAQLINLVSMPGLTRIYTPDHFGILAVFIAVVGIIAPFVTLRYSVPIPLLKNDGMAINLLVATITILFFMTILITFILAFYYHEIFAFFSITSLIAYWWLLPIAILGQGLFEVINSWSIRQKDFKSISKTSVLQIFSSNVLKILLGLLGMKPMGLLIGTMVSSISGFVALLLINYRNLLGNIKYIKKKYIFFLLYKYSEYPKYRLSSQFLLVLSAQVPLLFLAASFGTATAGHFALTMMTLSLPLSIFGNTTSQAYYAEISKIGRKNPHKIYEVTSHVVKRLFILSIGPFFILVIASPWLFGTIFGQQWYEAGVYASVMSFYMIAAFISAPIANVLSVFENQKLYLKLNFIRITLIAILFFISWIFDLSAFETILSYSLGMFIYFIYLSNFILNTIKEKL